MHKDPWDVLYRVVMETQVGSCLHRLLEKGDLGILQRIARLKVTQIAPSEIAVLFLPWYKDTAFGKGAWWVDGAIPYSVATWVNDKSDGTTEERNMVERMSKDEAFLKASGPSFVAVDTYLHRSILVDGSKRACAAYLADLPRSVLFFASAHARIFFPYDFIPHLKP